MRKVKKLNHKSEKIREVLNKLEIKNIRSNSDLFNFCRNILNARNYNLFQSLIYPDSLVLSLRSANDKTIFHVACGITNMDHNVLNNLLKHGADINAQKKNGLTPLHIALNMEVKQFIFGRVDQKNGYPCPEFFSNTRFLLKNGANLEICNKYHCTPVDRAVILGYLEGLEIFLNEEIPVETDNRCLYFIKCLLRKKYYTLTPRRCLQLLKFSIKNEDVESFKYVLTTKRQDMIRSKRNKVYERIGTEALCFAIVENKPQFIKVLINEGIDPKIRNAEGSFAIYYALLSRNIESFRLLLDCGISNNFTFYWNNESLLITAARINCVEMVELLLKRGADVNVVSRSKLPLIIVAFGIISQQPNVVKLLFQYGVNINVKDPHGQTALNYACELGNLKLVKVLLSHGATVECRNITTLHYAVLGTNSDIVRIILEQGLSVNNSCEKYGTPLKMAISRCNNFTSNKDIIMRPVLEILLAHVAKMIISNKYICKENRELLKDEPVKKMYEVYAEELTNMKERNVRPEVNFSFLDILTKDIDCVGRVLNQGDLILVLRNKAEYQKEFPNHSNNLKVRIQEAVHRRYLVETNIRFLSWHTNRSIPFEIFLLIFKNLKIDDLKNFSKAHCFDRIE